MKTFAIAKTIVLSSSSSVTFRKVKKDDSYFTVSITGKFEMSLVMEIEKAMLAFTQITGCLFYYMGDNTMNQLVADSLTGGFTVNEVHLVAVDPYWFL